MFLFCFSFQAYPWPDSATRGVQKVLQVDMLGPKLKKLFKTYTPIKRMFLPNTYEPIKRIWRHCNVCRKDLECQRNRRKIGLDVAWYFFSLPSHFPTRGPGTCDM